MSKTIEILVRLDGSTQIETKGFHGASCLQASRFVEQALGRAMHEERTAEFYQADAVQQHDHLRQA